MIGIVVGLSARQFRGFVGGGNIGVVEVVNVISSSKYIVQDLKNFGDDPSIKAIVIRVDSPGGGVAAAQEIYDEVKKVKKSKPVVVSMGAIAASGGYYISLPADVIVANPGTITGSIGVIMEFPVFEKLLKKLGINFEIIKSREHKDIGSPFRPMTGKEKKLMREVVIDVYDQFVEVTVENRGIERDSVLKFADGRIFSGRQAKTLGFVDTLGSFEDAVKIAGKKVGIEKPNIVYPPRRFSLIDLFTKPTEYLFLPKLSYIWH